MAADSPILVETGRATAERVTLTRDTNGLLIIPTTVVRLTVINGPATAHFDLNPVDAVDFATSIIGLARGDELRQSEVVSLGLASHGSEKPFDWSALRKLRKTDNGY